MILVSPVLVTEIYAFFLFAAVSVGVWFVPDEEIIEMWERR